MFSSEHIQNKVLTITSEHPSSEVHFEIKLQTNIFHLIKFLKNKRRIYRVEWEKTNVIKHVLIITRSKLSA